VSGVVPLEDEQFARLPTRIGARVTHPTNVIMSSYFAFGGSNARLIVGEYSPVKEKQILEIRRTILETLRLTAGI
jgi:hypothetical protein